MILKFSEGVVAINSEKEKKKKKIDQGAILVSVVPEGLLKNDHEINK